MKGEFMDPQENKDTTSSLFTKIHHYHHHLPPPPPTFHHQLTAAVDDPENRSPPSPTSADDKKKPITPQQLSATLPPTNFSGNDGATIEVVRRPRGRPPGSKNKLKPPVIVTRDAEAPPMSPYILELPAGVDVIDSVTRFCRKRNMGLCVLNGSGTVANVTFRQPSTTSGATVTFHGRFDILAISATVVLQNSGFMAAIANGFTISLGGPQGQVVGGVVVGPLVSAGTVYLISATFNNPSYYRFPAEDKTRKSGGGSEGCHSPPQTVVSCGGESSAAASESIYSCNLPSDVIWAPTARQPPPPPY